jgi:hypothetical protein
VFANYYNGQDYYNNYYDQRLAGAPPAPVPDLRW